MTVAVMGWDLTIDLVDEASCKVDTPGREFGFEVEVGSSMLCEVMFAGIGYRGVSVTAGKIVGTLVEVGVSVACGKLVGTLVEVGVPEVLDSNTDITEDCCTSAVVNIEDDSLDWDRWLYTLCGIGGAPTGSVMRVVASYEVCLTVVEPSHSLHQDAHRPLISANIMEQVCLLCSFGCAAESGVDSRLGGGVTVTVEAYVVTVA